MKILMTLRNGWTDERHKFLITPEQRRAIKALLDATNLEGDTEWMVDFLVDDVDAIDLTKPQAGEH